MNLVIDVGNTRIKLAVFESDKLLCIAPAEESTFRSSLQHLQTEYRGIQKAILSCVGDFSEQNKTYLQENFQVIEVSKSLKFPFTNTYTTPETLGVDRLVLVSAAAKSYPNKNVLVIDAGSCITYDFLSDKAIYEGGAISPGIQFRYRSLNEYTHALPLLEPKHIGSYVGNSTDNAIHVGVVQSVVYEISGFIASYRKNNNNLTVILTGGDAHFLRDSLKNDIFANSNFLLEGLNYILEHNTH